MECLFTKYQYFHKSQIDIWLDTALKSGTQICIDILQYNIFGF